MNVSNGFNTDECRFNLPFAALYKQPWCSVNSNVKGKSQFLYFSFSKQGEQTNFKKWFTRTAAERRRPLGERARRAERAMLRERAQCPCQVKCQVRDVQSLPRKPRRIARTARRSSEVSKRERIETSQFKRKHMFTTTVCPRRVTHDFPASPPSDPPSDHPVTVAAERTVAAAAAVVACTRPSMSPRTLPLRGGDTLDGVVVVVVKDKTLHLNMSTSFPPAL